MWPAKSLSAGRDEAYESKLEDLVEGRGLKEHIDSLGERTDVPALLAAADFGVLSSCEEGFSNVILESMAAELPMIVRNVVGLPEAVLDRETGLVVPPNPAALGGRCLELAHNPDLRRRLGSAALLRVRKDFSVESCVQTHESLYEQLLAERVSTARRAAWGNLVEALGSKLSANFTLVE